MARRGNNIYKRKDGRYEGRVPVGYHDNGKIRYKSVYARTLSEVKEKMAAIYSIGQKQSAPASKMTFREAAEQWLLMEKLRVKPSRQHKLSCLHTSFCICLSIFPCS